MTLLGVAWIFGFFLIIEETNTIWLRWLFIIFNSTQVLPLSFTFSLITSFHFNSTKVLVLLLSFSFLKFSFSFLVENSQPSSRNYGLLQGIFIFILYVALNDNLKKVWRKLLNIADSDKPTHSSVPYSRSKG